MTAGTGRQASGYDDVVDLSRYPINDPADPAYRALVQAGQDQLRDQGVAQLTGFLTPTAVRQMLTLASQLAAQAWASDQVRTVYFEPADDSAGPDHPRALITRARCCSTRPSRPSPTTRSPLTRRSGGYTNPMT